MLSLPLFLNWWCGGWKSFQEQWTKLVHLENDKLVYFGDGEEDVEHDHPEGGPVTEPRQGTGQDEEQQAQRAGEGQCDQGPDTRHVSYLNLIK